MITCSSNQNCRPIPFSAPHLLREALRTSAGGRLRSLGTRTVSMHGRCEAFHQGIGRNMQKPSSIHQATPATETGACVLKRQGGRFSVDEVEKLGEVLLLDEPDQLIRRRRRRTTSRVVPRKVSSKTYANRAPILGGWDLVENIDPSRCRLDLAGDNGTWSALLQRPSHPAT